MVPKCAYALVINGLLERSEECFTWELYHETGASQELAFVEFTWEFVEHLRIGLLVKVSETHKILEHLEDKNHRYQCWIKEGYITAKLFEWDI